MIEKFIHANTKREVFVALPLIFAVYYLPENKCTALLSIGGAIIPVKESVDEVKKRMKGHYDLQKKTQ